MLSFCFLYISVGDVCGGTVGASSVGASCNVVSSRPDFCKNMVMQLKIYVHVTESMKKFI